MYDLPINLSKLDFPLENMFGNINMNNMNFV